MESRIKDIKSIFTKPENRLKLFIIIGLIGVFLIVASEIIPQNKEITTPNSDLTYTEYVDQLEHKTKDIISSIDGVGECNVMITLMSSNESVYAKNADEKTDSSSNSQKYEYVLYDSASGDEPLLIKQYFPAVQGVVVVCSGGDNVAVRECVINSISALYSIPSSKITVSKLKG